MTRYERLCSNPRRRANSSTHLPRTCSRASRGCELPEARSPLLGEYLRCYTPRAHRKSDKASSKQRFAAREAASPPPPVSFPLRQSKRFRQKDFRHAVCRVERVAFAQVPLSFGGSIRGCAP